MSPPRADRATESGSVIVMESGSEMPPSQRREAGRKSRRRPRERLGWPSPQRPWPMARPFLSAGTGCGKAAATCPMIGTATATVAAETGPSTVTGSGRGSGSGCAKRSARESVHRKGIGTGTETVTASGCGSVTWCGCVTGATSPQMSASGTVVSGTAAGSVKRSATGSESATGIGSGARMEKRSESGRGSPPGGRSPRPARDGRRRHHHHPHPAAQRRRQAPRPSAPPPPLAAAPGWPASEPQMPACTAGTGPSGRG